MKSIYNKLRKNFPYLEICIWNTSILNEFMIHQPNNYYLLIEVEKMAVESIFYFLKELKFSVFIEPNHDILEKYLPNEKDALIVKSLVSEAPVQKVVNINTTSLEKILVDIFCDDIIFSSQQGVEMKTIFKEALRKYSVNHDRMLRYANRRGKKESFNNYINSISNLRQ